MAEIRKMNEARLDNLLKDITVRGEEIRSLQDEKQSVMDEFRKECERFRNGRISEQSLIASTKKVNSELAALDLKIRRSIKTSQANTRRTHFYVESQVPERYRATHGGIIRVAKKRRELLAEIQKARKAVKARRPARRKEQRPARKRAQRSAQKKARRPARKRAQRSARRRKR